MDFKEAGRRVCTDSVCSEEEPVTALVNRVTETSGSVSGRFLMDLHDC